MSMYQIFLALQISIVFKKICTGRCKNCWGRSIVTVAIMNIGSVWPYGKSTFPGRYCNRLVPDGIPITKDVSCWFVDTRRHWKQALKKRWEWNINSETSRLYYNKTCPLDNTVGRSALTASFSLLRGIFCDGCTWNIFGDRKPITHNSVIVSVSCQRTLTFTGNPSHITFT